MKLVLFVHQAAELYGSDKVLLYLVCGLRANGTVWPVVVLPEHGPLEDELVRHGIEVHVADVAKISRAVFSPRGLVRLARSAWSALAAFDAIVAGRRVDAVHSNTLAVLAGAVWAQLRRVPHLWHVHEIIRTPKLVSRGFPWLVRCLADKVVSNSTMTQQWLLDHQPRLAPRCAVVFNGLPEQALAAVASVQAFRTQVGAGVNDVLVVVAGRLNAWKGQGLLIEALAQLLQQGRLGVVRLAIVGDTAPGQGHWNDTLRAAVKQAGLDERVVFVSFVADIRPVWQAADIAVVPSTEPEPFGMVAIEAMAAGVPVVAAGHGGLLDIVEPERTGLLFEPCHADALAAAVQRLALDPALRQRLGQAGQQAQRARFSAASQVRAFEQIYIQMAAGPGARTEGQTA